VNSGKTLFAQLMDFLPWSTFTRIVARYGGDQRVRTLSCGEHYRAMAFAQLTYRESLRDIETCLVGAGLETLLHGLPRSRAALDPGRCQRGARLAHLRGVGPATDCPGETAVRQRGFGFDLANTVYALDSTTIDLCLAVFPWAHFRTTKACPWRKQGAAVKMHTLLDLRGNIPSFIHVSDGKLHDVHALDLLLPEAGAIYIMDRGYVDFARLNVLHLAGAFFVTRAKANMNSHRVYSAPTDRTTGIICDQTIALDGHYTSQHYPEHLRRIRLRDAETGKTLVFLTNQFGLPATTIGALYKMPLASRTVLQMDQTASPDQTLLRDIRKCRKDPNLDRRLSLRPRRHRQEAACLGRLALHIATDLLGHPLRENADASGTCPRRSQMQCLANN
jgi:hypothetical protein